MELQDNPDGVGKICIDEDDCKKHQEKEKCLVHQIDDKRS